MPDHDLRRIHHELKDLGRALLNEREHSTSIQNQLQDTLDELYRIASRGSHSAARTTRGRETHPVTKRHRRLDGLSRPL